MDNEWIIPFDMSQPEEAEWYEVWAEFEDKSGWEHIDTCKNETSAGWRADGYAADNPGRRVVAVRKKESRTPVKEYGYEKD